MPITIPNYSGKTDRHEFGTLIGISSERWNADRHQFGTTDRSPTVRREDLKTTADLLSVCEARQRAGASESRSHTIAFLSRDSVAAKLPSGEIAKRS